MQKLLTIVNVVEILGISEVTAKIWASKRVCLKDKGRESYPDLFIGSKTFVGFERIRQAHLKIRKL